MAAVIDWKNRYNGIENNVSLKIGFVCLYVECSCSNDITNCVGACVFALQFVSPRMTKLALKIGFIRIFLHWFVGILIRIHKQKLIC